MTWQFWDEQINDSTERLLNSYEKEKNKIAISLVPDMILVLQKITEISNDVTNESDYISRVYDLECLAQDILDSIRG